MSFPRHWTRTDQTSDGKPLEYTGLFGLRIKCAGGKRPWRIVNARGQFARSARGRTLCFSSPDAAARKAEQPKGVTEDFLFSHKATVQYLEQSR
jgi:hypothetical protein